MLTDNALANFFFSTIMALISAAIVKYGLDAPDWGAMSVYLIVYQIWRSKLDM